MSKIVGVAALAIDAGINLIGLGSIASGGDAGSCSDK